MSIKFVIYEVWILLFSTLTFFFFTAYVFGFSVLFYILFSNVYIFIFIELIVYFFFCLCMADTIRFKDCEIQQTPIHELVCSKVEPKTPVISKSKRNSYEVKAVVDFEGKNCHPGPACLHLP